MTGRYSLAAPTLMMRSPQLTAERGHRPQARDKRSEPLAGHLVRVGNLMDVGI